MTWRRDELGFNSRCIDLIHGDVIKWKHFPRHWPLCGKFTGDRWIPRTKAGDAELWCFLWSAPWINGWVNNSQVGDLRRHCAHYDVIVMFRSVFMLWLIIHCILINHSSKLVSMMAWRRVEDYPSFNSMMTQLETGSSLYKMVDNLLFVAKSSAKG